IPNITAPTEPITVKKPFTPQAHGINAPDSLLTAFMPVGNGTPNKIPIGATNNNVIMMRINKGHWIVDLKSIGVIKEVNSITINNAGRYFFASVLLLTFLTPLR